MPQGLPVTLVVEGVQALAAPADVRVRGEEAFGQQFRRDVRLADEVAEGGPLDRPFPFEQMDRRVRGREAGVRQVASSSARGMAARRPARLRSFMSVLLADERQVLQTRRRQPAAGRT